MNKLYVFDLDGVLIDSLQNMSQAWDAVRVKHEIDTPFEDYKAQIGKPFPDIMRELGLYHRHFEIYQTYKTYSRLHYDMIPLYEGVFETLTELKNRGHKIALCTSKARDSVKLIEHKLPEFDIISCPKQGLRGKPAPDQLLHCMAYCNIDPVDTISKHNRLLNAADVPEENRWFLAGPEFVEQLGQANSKLMSDTTGNAAPLRNGKVLSGKIMNMDVYMTNNFAASSTSNFFKVLSGHMSSTATANHIAKIEVIRDTDSFSDVVRGLHVFGRKVLRDTALVAEHIKID